MDSNVPDNALNTPPPNDSSLNVSPLNVEGRTPPLRVYSPAGLPKALLTAIRPHQATKNLFVFAALAFTGELFNLRKLGMTTLAFILFTLTAGSIYLLNDLLDVEQDCRHPRKCKRPIASGALPVPIAKIMFVVLAAGSLGAAFWLNVPFALALLGYFLLQIAYCIKLKHIVLIDVFTIAIGFVLRAVAGALMINVNISHWLLLCTLQLALFLGFGKRRQELVLLGEDAGRHRANLDEYSKPLLDQIINIVVGVTIVCYSVYSVESITAQQHPHLWITVPVVIYALFRYMYLVYQKGWGGAPDEVLQKDRVLQAAIVVWFVLVLLLFKFDHGNWAALGK
jgi:4-hydroxybenzoate polyprenyltransferase